MSTFGQSRRAWASQSPFGSPNQNPFGNPSQSPFDNPTQHPFSSPGTRTSFGSTPRSSFRGFDAPSIGFGTSSWGAGATDTSKQPFVPMIEYEMDGQSAYQNICFQDPYKKSSQEELRLGDYRQGHRYGSPFGAVGPTGFESASSVFGTDSSGFGSGTLAFGSGSSGFGGCGQRSYSAPGQAFGRDAQTNGGFGLKPAAMTGFGSPPSSSSFIRVGTGGAYPSAWTQQSQPTVPFGTQPSSFSFASRGEQQALKLGITDTSQTNPFGAKPTFGQGPNTEISYSRPTTAPGSFGSVVGTAQAAPSTGSLFAGTQLPSPSTTASYSQAPQPPRQPWRQVLQAQSSGTGLFSGGIPEGSSISTGIAPIPVQQQQQAPDPAPPQITAKIDDITAYGAPWLFADEKQHRQLPDEGPLAVRSAGQRPRHRSMSPGFKYDRPVFATRQIFPSHLSSGAGRGY